MSENSKIEWTDHTFNAWWGCEKVSAGCKFCYAESLDNRYHNANPHWGPGSGRKPMSENYWKQPVKWNAAAKKAGVKAKVFCSSMADVFEGHHQTAEHLVRLFRLILDTPWLTWQLLTKRPDNILALIPREWQFDFPENVWLGTSLENQEQISRVLHLHKTPAKVKFLSCEPLLGPLFLQGDFGDKSYNWLNNSGVGSTINWVIVGGESGPHARPMHPDWARSLRDQCRDAGVAFHFKQWGEWVPVIENVHQKNMSEVPSPEKMATQSQWLNYAGGQGFHGEKVCMVSKAGKKKSGRTIDGRTWDEFPLLSTTGIPAETGSRIGE